MQTMDMEVQLKRHTGGWKIIPEMKTTEHKPEGGRLARFYLRAEKRECAESMAHRRKGKTDRVEESREISHLVYF
jgi:hypothetical protein